MNKSSKNKSIEVENVPFEELVSELLEVPPRENKSKRAEKSKKKSKKQT